MVKVRGGGKNISVRNVNSGFGRREQSLTELGGQVFSPRPTKDQCLRSPGQLSCTGDSHAEPLSPAGLLQPRSSRSPGPRGASALTDGGPHSFLQQPNPSPRFRSKPPTPAHQRNMACPSLGVTSSGKRDPGRGYGDTDLGSPRSRAGKE